MAKIAVLGHGVVGSGVAELLQMNSESIAAKAGEKIEIKSILDLRDFDNLPYADKFTKDFNEILNDGEISVVVEVMGGLHPAYEYVMSSLEKGKSVVTSNKELVAEKGAELLKTARENNVNFFFEASVGGGIPIIRPMHMCLAANQISEIAGILNGTTNFILTKMIHEQMPFDEALKLAQELGYAERDPSADIEGKDTCRKICILASLAFGHHVYPEAVYTEGITKITLEDIAYAENWGGVVKLIGSAKQLDGEKLSVLVAPAFISRQSQLASIEDVFNGILVRGDATGDVVFYGKGAGKLPTASAVVADVIDVVKAPSTSESLSWGDAVENYVVDHRETETKFYLRCMASDVPAAKAALMNHFGCVNYLSRKGAAADELGFVLGPVAENELDGALRAIDGLNVLAKIRVFDY